MPRPAILASVLTAGLCASTAMASTVDVISFSGLVEPSTSGPSDKDGYPPVSGSADPEEAILAVRLVVTAPLVTPSATLFDADVDAVDDLTIDGDNPRDLDGLDGASDGVLLPGTYTLYWNLEKTGYKTNLPSSSAGLSETNDVEDFWVEVSHGGSTLASPTWTVTCENSASINQNDLDFDEAAFPPTPPPQGTVYQMRSKYHQSSAGGMSYLTTQLYYEGAVLRVLASNLYYYDTDGADPGSVATGVPSGWAWLFADQPSLLPGDLPASLSTGDHWVLENTIEVWGPGTSWLHPYIQTKASANANWKLDSGYGGFFADQGFYGLPEDCTQDTTPPEIECPPDTELAVDAACCATWDVSATATDDCDPNPTVGSDPTLPATLCGLGPHVITYTATDAAGNEASCSTTVTLVDLTAPTISCPPDQTIVADASCCATWNANATATDDCDPNPTVISDPTLPATLCGLGPHVITYTATDAAGNEASCSTTVTVVDVTPPMLTVSTAVTCLWPPNHKFVDVGLSVAATDDCTPASAMEVRVASVLSDELTAHQRGAGGPRHCPDAIVDGTRLLLRAERSGNEDGRVYTIFVTATDASGNTATATVQVNVPHDQHPKTRGQTRGNDPDGPCPAIDTGRNVDATACPPRR